VRILEAMALMDGGTTCISLEDGCQVLHATFDNSLPWDGRTRHLNLSSERFDCEESHDWLRDLRGKGR
jgi:hypothetical protein